MSFSLNFLHGLGQGNFRFFTFLALAPSFEVRFFWDTYQWTRLEETFRMDIDFFQKFNFDANFYEKTDFHFFSIYSKS